MSKALLLLIFHVEHSWRWSTVCVPAYVSSATWTLYANNPALFCSRVSFENANTGCYPSVYFPLLSLYIAHVCTESVGKTLGLHTCDVTFVPEVGNVYKFNCTNQHSEALFSVCQYVKRGASIDFPHWCFDEEMTCKKQDVVSSQLIIIESRMFVGHCGSRSLTVFL